MLLFCSMAVATCQIQLGRFVREVGTFVVIAVGAVEPVAVLGVVAVAALAVAVDTCDGWACET